MIKTIKYLFLSLLGVSLIFSSAVSGVWLWENYRNPKALVIIEPTQFVPVNKCKDADYGYRS